MLVSDAAAPRCGRLALKRISRRRAIHTGRYHPSYWTIGKIAGFLSQVQGR